MRSEVRGCLAIACLIFVVMLGAWAAQDHHDVHPQQLDLPEVLAPSSPLVFVGVPDPPPSPPAPTQFCANGRDGLLWADAVGQSVLRYNATFHSWGVPCPRLLRHPTPRGVPITPQLREQLVKTPSRGEHFRNYPALARFENTCMDGKALLTTPRGVNIAKMKETDVAEWLLPVSQRIPAYPNTGTYHNITALFMRSPHHRNIAHSFHDALFVSLHYLRAYHKVSTPILLAHTDEWLMDVPEVGLPKKWSDGLLVSAMMDLGISRNALLTLRKGQIHCFREVVYVGSTRENCVDANDCKASGRAATFRWVSALRRFSFPSGVVPSRRGVSVALYSRQDAPNRRLANDTLLAQCIIDQLNANGKFKNVRIAVIDRMPRVFSEQVQLWATADIMISMVGASNTNALWMNENSAVVELSACSMGYLSWMFRVVRPSQGKIKFRLCNKKKTGVAGISKVGDLGRWYSVPCEALKLLRVKQYGPVEAIEYFMKDILKK